jgi:hypothetical protein
MHVEAIVQELLKIMFNCRSNNSLGEGFTANKG